MRLGHFVPSACDRNWFDEDRARLTVRCLLQRLVNRLLVVNNFNVGCFLLLWLDIPDQVFEALRQACGLAVVYQETLNFLHDSLVVRVLEDQIRQVLDELWVVEQDSVNGALTFCQKFQRLKAVQDNVHSVVWVKGLPECLEKSDKVL